MRGFLCTSLSYCSASLYSRDNSPGTLLVVSQKDGRDGWPSNDLISDLESSDNVVLELLLDNVDVSDSLWLPASEGETGTLAGSVSPGDAGCCCWMLPRERSRPKDGRREWVRRDLTDETAVLGGGSSVSAAAEEREAATRALRSWKVEDDDEAGCWSDVMSGRTPTDTCDGLVA